MIFEKEMYPQVVSYLRNKGFNCYKEVKFLTRYIDLVGIKGKKVVAIEVKVKNWERALQQALTCRLCAHEVYVALWYKFVHRLPLNLFEEYGIGLISVDGTVNIIKKAKKSQIIHKSLLSNLLNELKS